MSLHRMSFRSRCLQSNSPSLVTCSNPSLLNTRVKISWLVCSIWTVPFWSDRSKHRGQWSSFSCYQTRIKLFFFVSRTLRRSKVPDKIFQSLYSSQNNCSTFSGKSSTIFWTTALSLFSINSFSCFSSFPHSASPKSITSWSKSMRVRNKTRDRNDTGFLSFPSSSCSRFFADSPRSPFSSCFVSR